MPTLNLPGRRRPTRDGAAGDAADGVALGGAALLVGLAALVGRALLAAGTNLLLPFPPLIASWAPHVGPGTPAAIGVAGLVVLRGPELAARLAWRPLLAVAYAGSAAWIVCLALVDGWQRGVVERLTSDQEYLHDVPRVTDIRAMLAGFADHILIDRPGFWSTHVGAHPPGTLLLFTALDRVGLGGGGPSGMVVMLVGASSAIAVAVTLRALGAETTARRALPFGVLLPGAVWIGVSADGLFAAVLAWAVALVTIGTTRAGPAADMAATAGGLLFGVTLYLSYGLVLGGALVLAALAAAATLCRSELGRSGWPVRATLFATAGTGLVVLMFSTSGFWWFTGLGRTRVIYAASIAAARPYGYFVWANLAALLFTAGPAVVVGLRRLGALSFRTSGFPARRLQTQEFGARNFRRAGFPPAAVLTCAALVAILLADLSGLSKAEVERIWLPFTVWLVPACAFLPGSGPAGSGAAGPGLPEPGPSEPGRRPGGAPSATAGRARALFGARALLATQAVLALTVNHLLLTPW